MKPTTIIALQVSWICATTVAYALNHQLDDSQRQVVEEDMFHEKLQDQHLLRRAMQMESSYNETTGYRSMSAAGPSAKRRVRRNLYDAAKGPLMVGVYYYPWHADDFHNDEGYLRDILDPHQSPELGEYDDREDAVIQQHLDWSRQANIQLWVNHKMNNDDSFSLNTHTFCHTR